MIISTKLADYALVSVKLTGQREKEGFVVRARI